MRGTRWKSSPSTTWSASCSPSRLPSSSAISMWAPLLGDYMHDSVMNEQTRHTLRIVGFAGGARRARHLVGAEIRRRAGLRRALPVRPVHLRGGVLQLRRTAPDSSTSMLTYPNQQDWSLSGIYFASLNDFYTFVLDHVVAAAPGLCGAHARRRDLYRLVRAARGRRPSGIIDAAHDLSGGAALLELSSCASSRKGLFEA